MEYLLNIVLLIAGFVVLIKGADFLVEAASYIARALKVPSLVIGLTIVAFGTSCPEAGVSIASSISGQNSLSYSNVVGSNTFNLLIVVGFTALLAAVAVDKDLLKFDFPICIICTSAMVAFCADKKFSRIEGIIFVVGIIAYTTYLVIRAKKSLVKDNVETDTEVSGPKPGEKGVGLKIFYRILIIIVSVAAITLSSKYMIVNPCSFFAEKMGVSQTIIGLTIVAMGTSLPELATSLVAMKKGENNIAMGNAVGSNIFNILFVLGMAGTIKPLEIGGDNFFDGIFCIGITVLAYVLSITGKKVSRIEGGTMVFIYIAYIAYAVMRELGFVTNLF